MKEKKKRLLLFIDSNVKTIPYEIPLTALSKNDYEIYFLSIQKPGPIHDEYEKLGLKVFSLYSEHISVKNLPFYIFRFIKLCRQQKIETVHAHLVFPSLIAVLSQSFIKARVVCFRHHFNFTNLVDGNYKINRIERWMDKTIASLAKKLILPSNSLREIIHKYEKVPLSKMQVIPYVYDWSRFSSYQRNDPGKKEKQLRLIMISRLTPLKRPKLAMDILSKLILGGIDASLTILGDGIMLEELKIYSSELNISNFVVLKGFQKDVRPFLHESDFLIHPSITEASNSVVKEAGVMGKIIIACKNVGDFNDYFQNGENGWLVDASSFVSDAVNILREYHQNPDKHKDMGNAMRELIVQKYSLSLEVLSMYKSVS